MKGVFRHTERGFSRNLIMRWVGVKGDLVSGVREVFTFKTSTVSRGLKVPIKIEKTYFIFFLCSPCNFVVTLRFLNFFFLIVLMRISNLHRGFSHTTFELGVKLSRPSTPDCPQPIRYSRVTYLIMTITSSPK